ncbi:MAG: MerR family transcriptional regulator [Pseudoruegeria sp.]
MKLEIFDSERIYDDLDEELNLIAARDKRAQWRHRLVGPPFMKFGRRVKYHGADLNKWAMESRVETTVPSIP